MPQPKPALTKRLWCCGVLALLLFAQKLLHDWPLGLAANVLWTCHLANLSMGAGLLARRGWLTRMGVLWIVAGVPIWLGDVLSQSTTWASVLAHIGGLGIAITLVRSEGWKAHRLDWLRAWLAFLLVQQVARAWAPPALNINLAHAVYPGWERIFPDYAAYALTIAVLMAVALWTTQAATAALHRHWLARAPNSPQPT